MINKNLFFISIFLLIIIVLTYQVLSSPSTHDHQQAINDNYICPMHPHIHGGKDDNCPICGMDLVLSPNNNNDNLLATKNNQSSDYICPMHPHIHGEKDDSCPVCGMDLVAARPTNNNTSFSVDTGIIQAMGVKTSEASHQNIRSEFIAYGRIVANTRSQKLISTRVAGWINTLNSDAIGDNIEKNQVLYELYSPDLISAQNDYINSLKSSNQNRIQATQTRLRLLGVQDSIITKIKSTKVVSENIQFLAPSSGIITRLSIRDGSYIKPGEELMMIEDLKTVWVEAQVPEKELASVVINSMATVKHPTKSLQAEAMIDFIEPMLNAQTRTATIRLILPNNNSQWLLESFVDVQLQGPIKHTLAVENQAILRTKDTNYVMIEKTPGRFIATSVTTGISNGEYTEITNGLAMGDNIVVSGQYLLDAEANLRFGLKKFSEDTNR